jgi:hypothetical protein
MPRKRVWFAICTHPNMNYDRSVRSIIWEKFPQFYRLYLNYLLEHPHLKSHMQLPTQTLLSLKQCAPDVLKLALELHARGQVRFMGTFFSEPLAQCMDEMTVLDSAQLGCDVARRELNAELEGFFLQEIAYTPAVPYMINRVGVGWTIFHDWEFGNDLHPCWLTGLDGSRCVGIPMIEHQRRNQLRENPDSMPQDTLITVHCDMEFPNAIHGLHQLETHFRTECGYDTRWCFISDYLQEVGVHVEKSPTPGTNKKEDPTSSPSLSRWCSDHLSMELHRQTLAAMEARRTAAILDPLGSTPVPFADPSRPHSTWDVETPAIYPELDTVLSANSTPAERMRHLLAWGTNSDARGWYPLLERRHERADTFAEAEWIANEQARAILDGMDPVAGAYAVNAGPGTLWRDEFLAPEPLALLTPDGKDAVEMVRRRGSEWEHQLRLELPPYSLLTLERQRQPRIPVQPKPGSSVAAGGATLAFADGVLTFSPSAGPSVQVTLPPFQICVRHLDTELRAPRPESAWRVASIPGTCPRLIAECQLDYHIHFQAEYTLDGDQVFADWRFLFTAPTLIDGLDDESTRKSPDFTPGGLRAKVAVGTGGDVHYDVPFGMVHHPNPEPSFVAPLTHALLETATGGVAVVSRSGSQSFELCGAQGSVAVCMGKSITSGGRRKLSFRIGDSITDFQHETDWYKEFFHGEVRHRFVILPFVGDWRKQALPTRCRALATGPRWVETSALMPGNQTLAELAPNNVHFAGIDAARQKAILVELCGLPANYRFRLAGKTHNGALQPFGIAEIDIS